MVVAPPCPIQFNGPLIQETGAIDHESKPTRHRHRRTRFSAWQRRLSSFRFESDKESFASTGGIVQQRNYHQAIDTANWQSNSRGGITWETHGSTTTSACARRCSRASQ